VKLPTATAISGEADAATLAKQKPPNRSMPPGEENPAIPRPEAVAISAQARALDERKGENPDGILAYPNDAL
jgi:hypothetical protein